MWADAQRDGRPAQAEYIRVAFCESSVIPFLVQRRKLSLTTIARVPYSNAANIGERKSETQSEFCTWQNSVQSLVDSPTKLCDGTQMANFWRFFASCISSEPRAAHFSDFRPAF